MQSPTYNQYQLTFMLSMLSNAAPSATIQSNSPEEAEQAILAAYNENLPKALEYINNNGSGQTVSIAWGPSLTVQSQDIVSNNDGGYTATATNTVVVFKTVTSEGSPSIYTVATAGTKASSMFDVLHEDALSGSIQSWPYGHNIDHPSISQGTLNGLSLLLGLTSNEDTVCSFLTKLTDNGAQIIFAGHSLGGALSPAFALTLFGNATNYAPHLLVQAKEQNWKINLYATAGPDVGNQDYVDYLTASFPPHEQQQGTPVYQQYNTKIWNSLDIVPRVWSKGFVKYIDAIYLPDANTPFDVKAFVEILYDLILKNNYLHNPYAKTDASGRGLFSGTYTYPLPAVSLINDDCSSNDECTDCNKLCEFVAEILYQHIDAYFNETELQGYLAVLAEGTKMDACAVTKKLFPLIKSHPTVLTK